MYMVLQQHLFNRPNELLSFRNAASQLGTEQVVAYGTAHQLWRADRLGVQNKLAQVVL